MVREIQAQESSTGVYTATLPVNNQGRLEEGVIVGRLQRGGQIVYGVAKQPARFTARSQSNEAPQTTTPGTGTGSSPGSSTAGTAPLAPVVTSHRSGDRIQTEGFTLVGETSPNATVQARVTAITSVFGVFQIGGDELLNTEVTADTNGRFELQVPRPTILQRDTRYRIELTARLNNQSSRATTLELRQR